MTNGKTKRRAASKKKAPTLRRLRAVPSNGGGNTTLHEDTLIGLTDPFSSQATEARYPDQGAGRTLTFQQRYSAVITTNAGGSFAMAVMAKSRFPLLASASISGNIVTWAAACTGNFDTNLLNTYGRIYRPTSVGIRIANTLSATDSSGYIIIAKGGAPPIGLTTTFDPSNFTGWDMHPNGHGEEWHTTLHPRDAMAYGMFASPAATTTTTVYDSWETCYIAGFGLPASSPSHVIEVFFNFEYTAAEDAPIAQLAKQSPVLDVSMQSAINAVQGSHPTSHKGNTDKVKGFIKKEAKKALLKHVVPFVAKKATQALL